MLVRNAVRALAAGDTLQVFATDPTTTRDLTNFCHFMGHSMLSSDTVSDAAGADEFHYLIRKNPSPA